jgi:hypothetical protein
MRLSIRSIRDATAPSCHAAARTRRWTAQVCKRPTPQPKVEFRTGTTEAAPPFGPEAPAVTAVIGINAIE